MSLGNTKLTSTVCGSKMAAIHCIGCCGAAKVTLGAASIAVCGKRQGLRTLRLDIHWKTGKRRAKTRVQQSTATGLTDDATYTQGVAGLILGADAQFTDYLPGQLRQSPFFGTPKKWVSDPGFYGRIPTVREAPAVVRIRILPVRRRDHLARKRMSHFKPPGSA